MSVEVAVLEWWLYDGEDVVIVRDQNDQVIDFIEAPDASTMKDFFDSQNPLQPWYSQDEFVDYDELQEELDDTTNLLATRSEDGIRIFEHEICEKRRAAFKTDR